MTDAALYVSIGVTGLLAIALATRIVLMLYRHDPTPDPGVDRL
ncbi:MAG: hypothetical protein ABEH66_06465 [Halobacteriales archaeon]